LPISQDSKLKFTADILIEIDKIEPRVVSGIADLLVGSKRGSGTVSAFTITNARSWMCDDYDYYFIMELKPPFHQLRPTMSKMQEKDQAFAEVTGLYETYRKLSVNLLTDGFVMLFLFKDCTKVFISDEDGLINEWEYIFYLLYALAVSEKSEIEDQDYELKECITINTTAGNQPDVVTQNVGEYQANDAELSSPQQNQPNQILPQNNQSSSVNPSNLALPYRRDDSIDFTYTEDEVEEMIASEIEFAKSFAAFLQNESYLCASRLKRTDDPTYIFRRFEADI
jgi:hypothetical protein